MSDFRDVNEEIPQYIGRLQQVISDLRSQLAAAQQERDLARSLREYEFDERDDEAINDGLEISGLNARLSAAQQDVDIANEASQFYNRKLADQIVLRNSDRERITALESQLAARDRTLGDVRAAVEDAPHDQICASGKFTTTLISDDDPCYLRYLQHSLNLPCDCFRSRLLALMPRAPEPLPVLP